MSVCVRVYMFTLFSGASLRVCPNSRPSTFALRKNMQKLQKLYELHDAKILCLMYCTWFDDNVIKIYNI